MTALLGDGAIHPDALATMRDRQRAGTAWHAYQNHALDSAGLGELRFLQVGDGCTYREAPVRYTDTSHGTGWRHVHVGVVNLETGAIE
jgi:hypothetical protein